MRQTFHSGEAMVSKKCRILNAQGHQVPVSVSTALLKDETGRILGGIETIRDRSEVHSLRRALANRYRLEDLVSKNAVMQRLFATLPQIAESDSSILIEGESGTGKEVVARVIHQLSSREKQPMVAVNCGALPDGLLESELFGYVPGAFTDAKRRRLGRFAQAENGTLFLDEIGEISPAFQVRLLRVLQDRSYEPLGSDVSVPSNVRIIAATNASLQALVDQGVFRRDLFYRIKVIRLVIPPLRERREDVPMLTRHFIEKFNAVMGKSIKGCDEAFLRTLLRYSFPGNVRELENIVEHSMVLCHDSCLGERHLPEELKGDLSVGALTPGITERECQRRSLIHALQANHWNREATARALGLHKTTLLRRIKKLGIVLPAKDGRSRGSKEALA
jgi:transcriptional regulator with PAS, ATPase and Fis domain